MAGPVAAKQFSHKWAALKGFSDRGCSNGKTQQRCNKKILRCLNKSNDGVLLDASSPLVLSL